MLKSDIFHFSVCVKYVLSYKINFSLGVLTKLDRKIKVIKYEINLIKTV